MIEALPFIHPAILPNEYRIKGSLLLIRSAVSLAASHAFAALIYSFTQRFVPTYLMLLTWTPWTLIDIYLSSRAAQVLAVKDYIEKEQPSEACIKAIAYSLTALKEVYEQGVSLVKEWPFSLAEEIIRFGNFSAFEILVDSGFAFHEHPACFAFLVTNDKRVWIDYLTVRAAIAANSFSSDSQYEIWRRLSNSEIGIQLIGLGFNVNSRNQRGRTALHSSILELRHLENEMMHPSNRTNIYVLILCGADINEVVRYGELEISLEDLLRQFDPIFYESIATIL
ncbi:MAG: hypothetical protein LW832_03740 [Parachlamydia sp.]|jgi:hypothetical protein|nr:hypothetical protein [Parachlamydia sp.]